MASPGAGAGSSGSSAAGTDAKGTTSERAMAVKDLRKYRSQTLKRYHMVVEFRRLMRHTPRGVYVLPDDGDIHAWHGVVFVRQSHYRGGVFKFSITVPEDYPVAGKDALPRVHFQQPVPYHPLVHPKSGDLELREHFGAWDPVAKPEEDNLAAVVAYVKHVFYMTNFNTATPNNGHARHLYRENQPLFFRKVEESAEAAAAAAERADDAGGVPFLPFNEDRHEAIRRQILEPYGGVAAISVPDVGSPADAKAEAGSSRGGSGGSDDADTAAAAAAVVAGSADTAADTAAGSVSAAAADVADTSPSDTAVEGAQFTPAVDVDAAAEADADAVAAPAGRSGAEAS